MPNKAPSGEEHNTRIIGTGQSGIECDHRVKKTYTNRTVK